MNEKKTSACRWKRGQDDKQQRKWRENSLLCLSPQHLSSPHIQSRFLMFRLLQKIVFLAVLVFFFINTFNFAYDGTILNLEIDGQSTTYHLTASSNGYIFAQWRLWPKYIENVTQQPVPQPANISILVSFCSACGEFQFGYRFIVLFHYLKVISLFLNKRLKVAVWI
jgi:hypothetical protein